MKLKIALSFLILSFNIYSAEWKVLNPKASLFDSKKIQFTSGDKGFILTKLELLCTNDGGNNWNIIKEDEGFVDMAFYNSLGMVIGSGKIYKTLDEGKTWEVIKIGYGDYAKSISIVSEDTIIVAASNKLFKTYDGGKVWQTIDIDNYNVRSIFFQNSKTGHATCNEEIILKTTNGGISWNKTYDTDGLGDFSPLYFVDKTTGFTYLENTGILKTTNGGSTWERLRNTGISKDINSFSFIDKDKGFAAGECGAVYSTIDGGVNWKFCGIQSENISDYDISSISFVNDQKGFSVGLNGRIYKTTNAGISWSGHSPFYHQVTSLAFLSQNTGYCISDGLYKTENGGNNWTLINNIYFDGIQCLNDSIFYGFNTYQLMKTIDGGKNWSKLELGTNNNVDGYSSICFTSVDTGFVSGGYNYKAIYRTTDGGNNWAKVAPIQSSKIQFVNSKIGLASVLKQIYKTADGGLTWNIFVDPYSYINAFDFVDENVGYWIDDNYIYKTIDGGKSWDKHYLTYMSSYNVRFYNKNIGFVFVESNYSNFIFKTIDGGVNWNLEKIPIFYNSDNFSAVCFTGNDIYVGGPSGILLKNSIYNSETDVLPIYNSDQNKLSIIPNPIQESFKIHGIDIFPVNIEVFDLTGKCVLAKKITHNTVDISDLNKGVYTLRIKHNMTITTRKLLKN